MRQRREPRRGGGIVETATCILVCFLFMFAIFEYGRYLMVHQLLNNAVREGARLAAVTTNTQNTAAIQNTVIVYLANQVIVNTAGKPISAADVQVYQSNPATGAAATPDSLWYDAALGSTIVVRVSALFRPMLPTFGYLPKAFTITATAQMRSEAN
jgi:Flp pilus assembly protein TadG